LRGRLRLQAPGREGTALAGPRRLAARPCLWRAVVRTFRRDSYLTPVPLLRRSPGPYVKGCNWMWRQVFQLSQPNPPVVESCRHVKCQPLNREGRRMFRVKLWYFSLALLLIALSTAGALVKSAPGDAADGGKTQPGAVVAYRGARIHTAAGPVIARGVLIVHKGKIVAVGSEETIKIPAGARGHDLTGKTIIPGLVDTHSHVGIFGRAGGQGSADGNEMTGPVQPGLRALDAINPDDAGFKMALAGGVTTANIMPGSGNAIGGQTVYVKF